MWYMEKDYDNTVALQNLSANFRKGAYAGSAPSGSATVNLMMMMMMMMMRR